VQKYGIHLIATEINILLTMIEKSIHVKRHDKKFAPIPDEINKIGSQIVDASFSVHRNLGPGLLEKIYEICFCYELEKRGIKFQRQVDVPVRYDSMTFTEGLRLDVLVEGIIICELKALDNVNPVWEAQILSQLKITGLRLGYLINFNVVNIGQGIRRFIL
jgi:GxxExxY protein